MAEAAEKLIDELKGDRLTSHQLYALGQVLCHVPPDSALAATCQKFLTIVPQGLFDDLDEALLSIPWSEVDSIIAALQSILALNRVVKSPPRKAPSANLIRHLISHILDNNRTDAHSQQQEVQDLSLDYTSLYLLRERDIESFLPIVHQLQESRVLWSKLVHRLSATTATTLSPSSAYSWHDIIRRNFPADQTDYLSTLLKHVDDQDDVATAQSSSIKMAVASVQASTKQPAKQPHSKKATPEQEMTRRIEQVKMVVPDYGDGFIEAALSQFQGNVETTVARLLEPVASWPAVLRTMDQHLPRRAQRKFNEDDPESREIVKARIKEAAAQEEKDALLLEVAMRHDEYEDDYDDQYDDMDGGGAGNIDVPDDYEAIRTYNRVLRGIESEQGYFDEIRNTNRDGRQRTPAPQGQAKQAEGSDDGNQSGDGDGGDDNDGGKTFRGPDKMRGGRIPGAGRGGRGRGRQNSAAPAATAAGAAGTNTEKATTAGGGTAKPNLRSKERKLDKRRDQQKKAQVKRAG
jgi:hypothetical protein